MKGKKELTKVKEKIESAINRFKSGKPVIVVDDKERENEGDLIYAAAFMTKKDVAFMLQNTSGIICVPCLPERLNRLHLPLMTKENTSKYGCSFAVSVDAKNVHTGVSAQERLLAILALASSQTKPNDLVRPGHIFPLSAKLNGVLERAGHTEAAIDLCQLADVTPVGVLAELMNRNGSMMRGKALVRFAKKYKIPIISITEIISYRLNFREESIKKNKESVTSFSSVIKHDAFIKHDAIRLPTSFGDFTLIPYEEKETHLVHLVLVKGVLSSKNSVLVRIHSECLTGDVFGSLRCDCGEQLATSLQLIEKEKNGILLYLRQEGRGIGLLAKLQAYKLQENGFDTVEANEILGYAADNRDYKIAASILHHLKVASVRLLTNNPRKIEALTEAGIIVSERIPLESIAGSHNKIYMQTKKEKLGHLFEHLH